jgi:predicted DNA-binding transcriptional regulator YafY
MKHSGAAQRYELIDQCLKDRDRKWTREALHKEVDAALKLSGVERGISIKTIDNDLKKMSSTFKAPIKKGRLGREDVYFYGDPGYAYKTPSFTGDQRKTFSVGALLLKQIPGFTVGDDMLSLVDKMGFTHDIIIDPETPIVDFNTGPKVPGREFLDALFVARYERIVVEVKYQPFHATKPRTWYLHPYLLKQHQMLWYLFCRNQEKEDYSVFALDRMLSVKPTDMKYIESGFKDNRDYFKDVVGVTVPKGEKPYDIELLFTPTWGRYIQTMPIHRSQRVLKKYPNGNILFGLRLLINPELLTLLSSYGKDVQVIKPQRLRDELLRKTLDTLNSQE